MATLITIALFVVWFTAIGVYYYRIGRHEAIYNPDAIRFFATQDICAHAGTEWSIIEMAKLADSRVLDVALVINMHIYPYVITLTLETYGTQYPIIIDRVKENARLVCPLGYSIDVRFKQ